MVIFNSYVKLPEGNKFKLNRTRSSAQQKSSDRLDCSAEFGTTVLFHAVSCSCLPSFYGTVQFRFNLMSPECSWIYHHFTTNLMFITAIFVDLPPILHIFCGAHAMSCHGNFQVPDSSGHLRLGSGPIGLASCHAGGRWPVGITCGPWDGIRDGVFF